MEGFGIRKVETAEDIYLLLKYYKEQGKLEWLNDEYYTDIVKETFRENKYVIMVYHKRRCKKCSEKWEILPIGILLMGKENKILNLTYMFVDLKYRDKPEIKKMIKEYIQSFFNEGIKQIKIFDGLYGRKYFEDYFNTPLQQYNIYVWEKEERKLGKEI